MTECERLLAQMGSNPKGPVPNWEFGYWDTTLPSWHEQGLPKEIDTPQKAYEYFGLEGPHFRDGYFVSGGKTRLCPTFEKRSLGIEDGIETFLDADGVKYQVFAEGASSIPHYLDYPIKGRADWEERYKPRLSTGTPARYVETDWSAARAAFKQSGRPVCLHMDSYVGYLRNLMGFEAFAMLPYDDPELLEEMVDALTQIKERVIDRLAGNIEVDLAMHWDDICYKAGPSMSPAAFEEIVVPRMKRVNDRLRNELGAKLISVDSDGDFLALADLWIEAGVNVLMPCEVDSGMDINALQERFGGRCGFFGGIQKKALLGGPKAIEKELERVLPAVRRGGYLPHLDHLCPGNVTLANYQFYIQAKRDILGCS